MNPNVDGRAASGMQRRTGVRGLVALAGACCVAALLLASPGAEATEAVQVDYLGKNLNGRLEWAPESTSRRVVLLVHDTADHAESPLMTTLQEGLSEAGINSLAITLSRGMNNREGPLRCDNLTESSHNQGIEEIGAWFDWLQRRDITPVSFLGHGRGGNQVAWFLAESEHPAFDRLVLLAPMTWDRERVAEDYRERFGESLHDVYRRAQEIAKEQGGSERLEGVGFLHCSDADVAVADFLEYYYDDRRFHTPELLDEVGAPTLVLHGSSDDSAPGLREAMTEGDWDHVEFVELNGHQYTEEPVRSEMVGHLVDFLVSDDE